MLQRRLTCGSAFVDFILGNSDCVKQANDRTSTLALRQVEDEGETGAKPGLFGKRWERTGPLMQACRLTLRTGIVVQ
jgi:hypothetical protein